MSDSIFSENSRNNIFVSDSIFNFMQGDFGARVVLKNISSVPVVKEIEVHSKKNNLINVVEKLKIYLADNGKLPFILNANFPIQICEEVYCSLNFLPNSSEYCIIEEHFLRSCTYSICDEIITPLNNILEQKETQGTFFSSLSFVKDIYDNIISVLFKMKCYESENIILVGKAGMGKTSILNYISNSIKTYPYFINTEIINCKKIKGKTVDSLQKFFTDTLIKLICSQPSLLILDDLQVLCDKCDGEETPNTIYINRVSEMLYTLFSITLKHNSVGILATTDSVSKLNRNIYRSRGNHLFKNVFDIGDLQKIDRILLLKFFFEQNLVDDTVDYDDLSIKTDGFVIQDIEDFYNKAVFEAYKDYQEYDKPIIIEQKHCDAALKKSCALSLQSVKFHSAGSKSFQDIGGLHNVKNILVESLLLPVKYSTIFSNAPLRLQSGILLYGPPGTGKTLLAGAAAKQCSLRLISIKGPELLSKYIGASEQAVRDVFEKAQRAKPCILFFDEFDSLAPRRGHDNTGVTDRVVNQLLTQLDGVEALTGVCVLAATSRPDLLDPALLRPGRLDKQLLCPMPNTADRLEILQILSQKLHLCQNINLNEIAKQSHGYSGADLQSLLYTAQLSSMNTLDQVECTNFDPVKISQDMMTEALVKTRPSLTQSEQIKYDRIYTKFRGGNIEDLKAGSKVTLA